MEITLITLGSVEIVVNVFQSLKPLEQALSTSTLQQRTITSNISNVDTPNYKRQAVSFQDNLHEAMSSHNLNSFKTNPNHFSFSTEQQNNKALVKTDASSLVKSNGNNVDMDLEMAELAKNQLLYNSIIEKTNNQIRDLRTAIRGGS